LRSEPRLGLFASADFGREEGLNEAIADAVRDESRLAVKDAIVEILSNPELKALIARPSEPVSEKPSFWSRLKARITRTRAVVIEAVTPAAQSATRAVRTANEPVVGLAKAVGSIWRWKKPVLIGTGVGFGIMVLCLAAPHGLAAVLSGVLGTITAVAVQFGHWVRKSVQKLQMV
jgi:hypothetical protein